VTNTVDNVDRPALLRHVGRWALLGAGSGLLATLSVHLPRWLGFYDELETKIRPLAPVLDSFAVQISPLSVGPGLVFGLIVGFALRRAGLAGGWRYPVYALASTLSYFVAVQLALGFLIDVLEDVVSVGIVTGLCGGGVLAAVSAALMPAFRRRRVCAVMTASGGVLGALLYFAIAFESFFGWLALYAPWQAGYAAAMALALDAAETDSTA
jgi:hypothetical protein